MYHRHTVDRTQDAKVCQQVYKFQKTFQPSAMFHGVALILFVSNWAGRFTGRNHKSGYMDVLTVGGVVNFYFDFPMT